MTLTTGRLRGRILRDRARFRLVLFEPLIPALAKRGQRGLDFVGTRQGEAAGHQVGERAGHDQAAVVGAGVEQDRFHALPSGQLPFRVRGDGDVAHRRQRSPDLLYYGHALRGIAGARQGNHRAAWADEAREIEQQFGGGDRQSAGPGRLDRHRRVGRSTGAGQHRIGDTRDLRRADATHRIRPDLGLLQDFSVSNRSGFRHHCLLRLPSTLKQAEAS